MNTDVTSPGCNLAILDIAKTSRPTVGFSITPGMADEIIEAFELTLARNPGDIAGEKSALFSYQGVTLRLKYEFPQRWKVYNGPWQSDPHWTGD